MSTTFQPRIITRESKRQTFRYPDERVDATVALLNELGPDQVVAIDEPQPTKSKALGRALKMRAQIEQHGTLAAGRTLRKTLVPEGDAFVPALYVVNEAKDKTKGKDK